MATTSMTKRRLSIIVCWAGDEMELCQCDSNPEQIADAAKLKYYTSVRVIDNYAEPPAAARKPNLGVMTCGS